MIASIQSEEGNGVTERAPPVQTMDEMSPSTSLSTIRAIEQRLREEQRVLIQEMEQRMMRELSECKSHSKPSKSVYETLRGNIDNVNANEPPGSANSNGNGNGEGDGEGNYFSMPSDVFSMLCLSETNSEPFFYALFFIIAKLFFYTLILWEIFHKSVFFPKEIASVVKFTQLVMLPVTVIVTDEGVLAALFVYRHLIYDEGILEQHRLATKFRYRSSNSARFMDAILYQTVLFFVLMQAQKILDIFLNFAALRFLMEIDTVAFAVARHGYLTEEMQEAAKEVESIKLVGKGSDFRQYTAKIFFAFSLVAMIASWAVVHYVFD